MSGDHNKSESGFGKWLGIFFKFFEVAAFIAIILTFWEMRETRIYDERAWVSFIQFKPTVDESNGTSVDWFFTANLKNTGKTPAIRVQAVCKWTQDSNQIKIYDSIPYPPINSGLMAPDTIANSSTDKIPMSVINAANNSIPFYCYGTVWYDDIFGNHHWSQFCQKFYGTPANWSSSVPAFHNSCDDAEAADWAVIFWRFVIGCGIIWVCIGWIFSPKTNRFYGDGK